MATLNFRNAYVFINGVDMADMTESVTLNYGSEMLDETAMGDDSRVNKGGLKTWSIDLNFHQDYDTAHVDATIWPLVGTTTCFDIRPLNQDSSGVNPRFVGIGIIESYQPMGGAVGSLLDAPVTIQSAGTLNRYTSAT